MQRLHFVQLNNFIKQQQTQPFRGKTMNVVYVINHKFSTNVRP